MGHDAARCIRWLGSARPCSLAHWIGVIIYGLVDWFIDWLFNWLIIELLPCSFNAIFSSLLFFFIWRFFVWLFLLISSLARLLVRVRAWSFIDLIDRLLACLTDWLAFLLLDLVEWSAGRLWGIGDFCFKLRKIHYRLQNHCNVVVFRG